MRWQRNYREKWTGWDGGVRERGELAGGAGLVEDSEAGQRGMVHRRATASVSVPSKCGIRGEYVPHHSQEHPRSMQDSFGLKLTGGLSATRT